MATKVVVTLSEGVSKEKADKIKADVAAHLHVTSEDVLLVHGVSAVSVLTVADVAHEEKKTQGRWNAPKDKE